MLILPVRPNIEHLRRQARDLLRAARAGDATAANRIQVVSDRVTLAGAQLAIARAYGFTSWARLRIEVKARTADLAKQAEVFCEASIRDWTGRAARMLATAPEIAQYSFAAAVVLGDADRVREDIRREPAVATRPDPRSGWTPLHAVCGSRWHRLDPTRTDGMLTVARILLDAGTDPNTETPRPPGQTSWTPLRCAVAGAANPAITRLLLDRGAVPEDHDLYLAGFADDDHECLRLLLDHMPHMAVSTAALAAPISTGDTEAVRLLLEAGIDPRHSASADLYGASHGNDSPWPPVYAAIRCRCAIELVELLLDHCADPNAVGPDGRSPYQLATSDGHNDLAALLHRRGAHADATDVVRLLAACLRADRAGAQRELADHPKLLDLLAGAGQGAVVLAAETGNTAAVRVMLELGFPVDARGGDAGGTALHAAGYAGSTVTVELLLDRGADLEARDTTWHSTPLVWAIIGSGERPADNPKPDWVATIRTLLDAGASTEGITLSADDEKPPSRQVAELLRSYGIAGTDRE